MDFFALGPRGRALAAEDSVTQHRGCPSETVQPNT